VHLQIDAGFLSDFFQMMILAAAVNLGQICIEDILQLHSAPYVKFAAGIIITPSTGEYFALLLHANKLEEFNS
jgi:hypothetical protein